MLNKKNFEEKVRKFFLTINRCARHICFHSHMENFKCHYLKTVFCDFSTSKTKLFVFLLFFAGYFHVKMSKNKSFLIKAQVCYKV